MFDDTIDYYDNNKRLPRKIKRTQWKQNACGCADEPATTESVPKDMTKTPRKDGKGYEEWRRRRKMEMKEKTKRERRSEHLFPSSQRGSGPPNTSPPRFVDAPTLLPKKKEKKEA